MLLEVDRNTDKLYIQIFLKYLEILAVVFLKAFSVVGVVGEIDQVLDGAMI